MSEEVQEQVAEEITLCPHCGQDYTRAASEISEEDKEAWIRHVLGEEYFTKTFEVFGGRMKVTFRSRKDYENRDISLELSKYVQDLKSIINSQSIHAEVSKYNLAISLQEIVTYDKEGVPDTRVFPPIPKEEFFRAWEKEGSSVSKRLYEERIADLGPGQIAALSTSMLRFDQLQLDLARHSNDPDFW
jgi:hypothetical protein